MKKILFFVSLLFVASCSQKSVAPNPVVIDTEKQILDEIKQQPDISAKVVEQLPFKKMDVTLSLGSGTNTASASYNYEIEYLNNGKIKVIKSDNKEIVSINYSTNQVSVNKGSAIDKYELGNDNLAKNTVDGLQKFYYKDGYLSRTNDSSNPNVKIIKNYSKEGNLIHLETNTEKSNYEYYDYPNNIRQEVLSPQAIHWSFRDDYLGRFSTNLLKKVTFINSATTLNFTYQFDSNNRVSKMIIERNAGNFNPANGIIEYTFSY
jgi:hypothetical protein